MRRTAFFGALVAATSLVLAGCLAPATGPVIEKRGVKRTYTVPTVKPEHSPDGFTFRSPHFELHFDEAISKMRGYETPDDRISRGLGAMVFLESQYNFLREVLGIDALAMIPIFVAPNIEGNEHDAYTRSGWQSDGKGAIQYAVAVYFGAEAFASPSIRAHEMTHAFTSIYGLPAWMNEGLGVFVESELAGGAGWARNNRSLKPLGFDENGYNVIQLWRREGSALTFRSVETYSYSYSVVTELSDRHGDPLFQRFFQLISEETKAQGPRMHTDEDIVSLLSRAAGTDLTPFFEKELQFKLSAMPAAAASPTLRVTPGDIPPLR